MTADDVFPIRLTHDEALVLSDSLYRHSTRTTGSGSKRLRNG